jgi:hypothetical protein
VEQQLLTRPATKDRTKALTNAVTHGQQFRVTGVADAVGKLEKEQKDTTVERKVWQKHQQQYEAALLLLEKPENSLLSKDIDVLLRYKLSELYLAISKQSLTSCKGGGK